MHFTPAHILLDGKLHDIPTIRIILSVMKKVFVKAEALDPRSLSHHLLQTNSHSKRWVGASGEERESRQRESVVWEGAIIAVVMGPCTYFMAPGVSSHSY